MKNRVLLLLAILGFSMLLMSDANAESALATCKKSISQKYEIEIHESISDGAMTYKEHEDIKFGNLDEQHSFVQYKDHVLEVERIPFKDLQHRTISLKSESVAIDRSALYVRQHKNCKTYCILVPFSGIGSSGSFQRFAALIAIGGRHADGEVKIAGEVIKRQ